MEQIIPFSRFIEDGNRHIPRKALRLRQTMDKFQRNKGLTEKLVTEKY